MKLKVLVSILLLLGSVVSASPVHAGGVVSICDEAHLLAALAGGGTVTFSCSGTIGLTAQITIGADTTLDGNGQTVSIFGNFVVRMFMVPAGSSLTLRHLSLVGGQASHGSGGAIYNLGSLIVADSAFVGNGADAHGGAILNYGTLDVSDTIFFSNGAGINGGAIDTTVDLSVHGSTFTENTAGFRGGAINNYLGSMTVEDSSFAGNNSSGYGGGLVNDGGDAVIRASHVLGNTAQGQGGGIKNSGVLEVQHSTFTGNMSGGGGGIGNDDGELNVIDSTFSGNTANYGGGIQNTNGSYVVVSNSIFADNSAPYGGGGIDNDGSSLKVNDSSFVRNSVTDLGGGIYNHDGTVDVSNCTFSDNIAFPYEGGGIYNSNGTLNVSNSTFSGNAAETAGGGIFNSCCASAATVSNSTFSGNSRHTISNYSALTLKNTIVANSPSGFNCDAYSPITNGGGNLSFGDATCPGIHGDPILGPLQNNGGPTQTMALGAGSAAIDAAVDATCAAAPVNGLDQRGVVRPQGAHCDIGAYEVTNQSVPERVFVPMIEITQ